MPSQFFGLNIGASALSAFQTSINTTANNIANVKTVGYTRQTTVLEATDPLRVYTTYGSAGSGVAATEIKQERSQYYDTKYWTNNSSKGFYEQKLYYLDQVQTILQDDENSQKGFSTIFATMFDSGLDTLKTRGEEIEVRNQFINQAQGLCTFFNQLSQSLVEIQEECNEEIKSSVDNINSIAEKIALLNKQIYAYEVRGGHANELRDQRANLIDELSEIVTVETMEYDVHNSFGQDLGGTNLRVYVNGQKIVDGDEYRTLECVASDYGYNQTDIKGLYSIVWSDTGMDFPATGGVAGGTLKGLFDVRDGNNAENMKGVVESTGTATVDGENRTTVTMNYPSVTDVNALALAARGMITINSKHYYYDSWEATVDANGVQSVTFNLNTELDAAECANLADKQVVCGQTVDCMGIPYYQSQLNEFLRNFSQMFNDIEMEGVDLNGDPMGAFFIGKSSTGIEFTGADWYAGLEALEGGDTSFTISSHGDSYYQVMASTICVNARSLKDASYFSTSSEIINGVAKYDIAEKLMTLQNSVTMFRGDNAESFLEVLISDISVDVNKTDSCATNYANLATVISNQRTSVSGVDEDEEAIALIQFQNAYNLASKVISVMAEVYDKLINETGVT